MALKNGDFVELEYTGKLADGTVFDVTSAERAKKEGIHQEGHPYGARIICLGEGNIVRGIDEFLAGKDIGSYTLSLGPEQAFGKKNAKLMRIMPLHTFTKQKIKPFPGLQINMDGFMGIIKTVSGGRVIVDFNHPLAGKEAAYDITVKRVVTDTKEKIAAYLKLLFGREMKHAFEKGVLTIDAALPPPVQEQLTTKMKELIAGIKTVGFQQGEKNKEEKENASTAR